MSQEHLPSPRGAPASEGDRRPGIAVAESEALQEAWALSRVVIDAAPIAIAMLDLDGRYTVVNDAFCAMVGYDSEQLVGSLRTDITHEDDRAADAGVLGALLAGGAMPDRYEKRYTHASGAVIWARVTVTVVRTGDGEPLRFVVFGEDVAEQRSYERRLAFLADHDPLTGLLNRAGLERELGVHVARGWRYGPAGAVLMLDLDHFKYFNDTQGHAAGDELIVRIAQAMRARLRGTDVLARLGGDEFAVLLPAGDERETRLVAEALVEVVRDEALPALEQGVSATLIGSGRRVTVSVGISRFDDGEHLTAGEMLVNADLAMYAAKNAGGDCLSRHRCPGTPAPKTEDPATSAEEIEHAIRHDGFELLAQPIFALGHDGPAQYELLLRMHDGRGRVIGPGSFLPIAERLGLVGDIDRWVIRRAIDMLAEQRALGRDLRFAINVSARTIADERLPELIERRLRETAVPPDRLTFEIAETAAAAHITRTTAFAQRLSRLGCRFALDDFGAGLGSFYLLKHLPFDYLKIDGEFVAQCTRSQTDRTLIAAVVQIAHGMGKRTIAEFTGDRETVELLTRLGVDYGQGFHLGRPAPLSQHLGTGEDAAMARDARSTAAAAPGASSGHVEVRCGQLHPMRCDVVLRAAGPSQLLILACAHGADVHGYTRAWYSPQRLASMTHAITQRASI